MSSTGWMTTLEVATLLGISRQRVGQLIQAGQLTARRAGRLWLVRAASVRKRLDKLKAPE